MTSKWTVRVKGIVVKNVLCLLCLLSIFSIFFFYFLQHKSHCEKKKNGRIAGQTVRQNTAEHSDVRKDVCLKMSSLRMHFMAGILNYCVILT